jgi:hypothetical protein
MGQVVAVDKMMAVYDEDGRQMTVFPDVCKNPAPPAPFVPVAYPVDGPPLPPAKTVGTKTDGTVAVATTGAVSKTTTGNEPGTLKSTAAAFWVEGSAQLIRVGKSVAMTGTPTLNNSEAAVVNELVTLGFSVNGAKRLIKGRPVESSADKLLLHTILTRRRARRGTVIFPGTT